MIDLLDQRIYEQGMYVKPTSRKNSIHIIGEVAKKIEDIDEEGENFWIYANETDLFLESDLISGTPQSKMMKSAIWKRCRKAM